MNKKVRVEIGYRTFVRLGLVAIGFALIGLFLIKSVPALIIIGSAIFLAVAISPLVNYISGILPSKKRSLSITLAYLLVIAFITAFIAIVGPTIINETIKFANNLPAILGGDNGIGATIGNVANNFGISNAQEQIVGFVGDFVRNFTNTLGAFIAASIGNIAATLTALILILVLSLFMLTEGPKILKDFWKNFRGNPEAKRAEKVFNRMADVVSRYVANALSVAIINACATAVAISVLSIIFRFSPGLALPFGLITGVFCLIPMFGAFIGGTLVSVLLAFSNPLAGLIFFIYTIIYLQIEANVISPKIQGRGLQLPALTILAAVTIGVYVFGLIGAIVAIPIAGCLKVLIEEYGSDIPFIEEKGKPATK